MWTPIADVTEENSKGENMRAAGQEVPLKSHLYSRTGRLFIIRLNTTKSYIVKVQAWDPCTQLYCSNDLTVAHSCTCFNMYVYMLRAAKHTCSPPKPWHI